jgi:hypothetical protein
MLEHTRRTTNGFPKHAARVALVLLAGCAVATHVPPVPQRLAPWGPALAAVPDVRWGEVGERGLRLPDRAAGVLLFDDAVRTDDGAWPRAQREALLQFVRGGGRVVLFGHAAHLASELGIEPVPPERSQFRWGYDARAIAGEARLGFQVVSGQQPELFDGVPASGSGQDTFVIAGGAPCTAPLCAWSHGTPQRGSVLARLMVQRDGADEALGAPVVVQWTLGRGAVLACGVLPRVDHEDAAVRDAAVAFVQHCASWAQQRGPLLVLAAAPPPAPPAAAALPPMAPLLAHWGWRLPQSGGAGERTVDELTQEALLPSWLAGASLAELEVADGDGRAPLDWRSGDPLHPAPSFESRADAQHWQASSFRALAAEAHARGMLAFGGLDPLPVGERAVERFATLRFLARDLACVRRFGERALDGFGLRQWSPDPNGISVQMLQDFQPAGVLLRAGELAPPIAGSVRALDAGDGAVRGLPFTGVAAPWRDGFAADAFPCGVLDAAAGATGHASTADWIVAQMNDFVRARAGRGGAVWWSRHEPASFDRDTLAYVNGVSLEPLRAAVAMQLASTGSDGLRAAGAALVPGLPGSFAPALPAPAAVTVLQNNWFRLLGSGGALDFDPAGRADFGGSAVRLCQTFLRTRLFGGRPDGRAVRSERLDLLANGTRGEGEYGEVARASTAPGGVGPPAILQRGAAPAWPAAVQFEWEADAGYYELELQPRTVRGRGVLTVRLDGALLRALPFDEQRREVAAVPVHAAHGGPRTLELAVLDGGSVAFDRLVLRRAGDVGVEARVDTPAGSYAALSEVSQSSYHAERIELATIADLPGFVLRACCERAVRNLQIERVFALPLHGGLGAHGKGDTADDLREPFVLRGADANVPDLVIAPLQRTRYETLRWRDGELSWRCAPEAGAQSRLAVLLCAHGTGAQWLAAVRTIGDAIHVPLALDVGAGRPATVSNPLPLAWTRVLAVRGAGATPFAVREDGFWYWRGSQPAADGARWLRIHHAPGDTVQIESGPSLLQRTRPGPGSLQLVALRDPQPRSVTVRVLQASALTSPSVTMERDFDAVELDGACWAHFDGRTVFLPNRAGIYTVVVREHAGGDAPHVRATRAPLSTCQWLPASSELVLMTAGDPERPAELPWTAVLAGPVPASIENGEVVDDASLRYPDAEAAAAARAGGVLVRFSNGTCRVHYRR